MIGRLVRITLIIAAIAVLGGCSATSRPQRVDTISSITGRWTGELADRGGSYPITILVRDDGTWDGISLGQRFQGTLRLVDGKVHIHNQVTGIGVTYTLYETEGLLTLRGVRDDGFVVGRLKPGP